LRQSNSSLQLKYMKFKHQALEVQRCIWAVESVKEQLNRLRKETAEKQAELDRFEKSLSLKWSGASFLGLTPENLNDHLPELYLDKVKRFSHISI